MGNNAHRGVRKSQKAGLRSIGRASFYNGEHLNSCSAIKGAPRATQADAKKIMSVLGAVNRMRLFTWAANAEALDLEMPPPIIAEIIERAREKLGIKVEV